MGSHTEYNVFSIKRYPQSGKPITTILATIPGKPVYMHSFSLTKKYVILIFIANANANEFINKYIYYLGEIYNDPNLHSEDQDELEIPKGNFF